MGDVAKPSTDYPTAAAFKDARASGRGYVRILRITTEQYRLSRLDPLLVVELSDDRPMSAVLDELVASIPCSRCGVVEGPCVTSSGRRAKAFHDARSGPVYAAYRLGRGVKW